MSGGDDPSAAGTALMGSVTDAAPGVALVVVELPEGRIADSSLSLPAVLGLPSPPIEGARIADLLDSSSARLIGDLMRAAGATEAPVPVSAVVVSVAGASVLAEVCRRQGARGSDPTSVWVIFSAGPRSSANPSQARTPPSHVDPLSGLPDRAAFIASVQDADLACRSSARRRLAVLVIDVDGLRFVNDAFDRETGDRVIAGVADRLRDTMRQELEFRPAGILMRAARLAGDEFALLVAGLESDWEVTWITERLILNLTLPMQFESQSIVLAVSIGTTLAGAESVSGERLLAQAEIAMHEAKRRGRAQAVQYNSDFGQWHRQGQRLRSQLARALDCGEVSAVFRPIFELQDGAIVGVETLARWNVRPEGVLSLGDSLVAGEDSALITALDRFVLEAACGALAYWAEKSPHSSPAFAAVRLSRHSWAVGARIETTLQSMLRQASVKPGSLVLELAHGDLLADPSGGREFVSIARSLGVRVALGQFGSGPLTGRALLGHSPEYARVDPQFSREARDHAGLQPVLGAALRYLADHDVPSLVEGLQAEEVRSLRDAGCSLGQGPRLVSDLVEAQVPSALAHRLSMLPTGRG